MNQTIGFTGLVAPSYRKHLAVKSVFRETGTYNDIFRRAYSSANVDGSLCSDFKQLVVSASDLANGYNVDMMSSISNRLLRPNPQVNPMADMGQIANGWSNRRFLFTIEISTDTSGNANIQPERIIINGYTDYTGGTASGAVDPNMRVYFNSVVMLRTINQHGYAFGGTTVIPTEASHVVHLVTDPNDNPYNGPSFRNPYTLLRPMDVVNNIDSQFLYNGQDTTVSDLRASAIAIPVLSSRENNIAPKYLEKTFKGLF